MKMKRLSLVATVLLLGAGQLCARTPTASDVSFCEGYSFIAQASFMALNAKQPFADDLRGITSDPLGAWYSRAVTFGKQPMPGTKDITQQAQRWCLFEMKSDIYPTIPGDPEAESASRTAWADDWRLVGGLPPASETFKGRFQTEGKLLSKDEVTFKRHDGKCDAKLGATFSNGYHACHIVSDGGAFLIGKFGDGGTGQERVPFVTMHP